MCGAFFKSWLNDQSSRGGRGAIVVCCQTSWFFLDSVHNSCHIISVCVFSSSPESIILSLPSCCQPFHLCHTHSDIPICFFIASVLCVAPTPHQWAIGLSFGPLRSSKHLHPSSNPYLLFLLFVLKVAVAPIALSATLHSLPHRSVRWDETLPTRWHSQIKNLRVHLSDLLRLYFEFPFLTQKNWRNFDSVALLSWRHLAISVYQSQMFSKKLRKQDNLQL